MKIASVRMAKVTPADTKRLRITQQEDARSVTADISPNETSQSEDMGSSSSMAGTYVLIAVVLFVVGLAFSAVASLQLVIPDLLGGIAVTSYGRLVQAGRTLVFDGWLPIAGLGLGIWAISEVTGESIKRRTLGTVALVVIALGAIAGAGSVLLGMSTGVSGLESVVWARAISAIGFTLAALVVTATAQQKRDNLGPAGWYLTAASWWLAASALVGLLPLLSGTPGTIQAAFADAGLHRLFVITVAVGLLYFALSRISGADLSEPRPLAALGFWSLTLTWAFMGGVALIYSATPDWYETLTVAFAIGTLVPVLVIVTDLGLILKGHIAEITDRASLRYAVVAGLALIGATIVNLLLAWRATSGVVQYSTWMGGLDVVLVLGGASFAIFSVNSIRRGGKSSGAGAHFVLSVIAVSGAAVGLLAGGIVSGFSWIAGPSSQLFGNFGPGYEVAVASLTPFLWLTAVSLSVYAAAQIVYLFGVNSVSDEQLAIPDAPPEYNLQFEGAVRYVTWKRLVWGAAAVWLAAALFTAVLPAMDDSDTAATITADRSRTYSQGTPEASGRVLYISEGCAECHTQSVRPIVADVGLGAVSIAGDYAYENPTLITGTRIGPDLTHIASRSEAFDVSGIWAHLKDPRSTVKWSNMPSYAYLSDTDLEALVRYLATLR